MHDYLMIVPEGWGYKPERATARIEILECPSMPLWRRFFWERRVLHPAIDTYKPDWLWAIGNHGLKTAKWRQSLLVSDAHYVGYSWKYLGYRYIDLLGAYPLLQVKKHSVRRSSRFSQRIYLQTDTMRKRFAEHFGVSPDRLGLCPNSFSLRLVWSTEWPEKLDRFRGKFILLMLTTYGVDYGHKNLRRVLQMFIKYRRELSDVVCVLPLSEDQNRFTRSFLRRVKKHGLEESLPSIGTISHHELGSYYHAADVLFLPTTLESFSSAYVEAMYFGTPLLTSDLDFARETCADAAHYVDPFSIESIKDGILRLRDNPDYRRDLVDKGRRQLAAHVKSWPCILGEILNQEGIEHLEPLEDEL